MATATTARTTKANARTTKSNARTTKSNAKATARSASTTARSAKNTTKRTANNASTTTRREARKAEQGVVRHGRRVVEAAQAEVSAVASQPTRPLFFTLGVVDRAASTVKALPGTLTSTVVSAPVRTRGRIVNVFATAEVAQAAVRRR